MIDHRINHASRNVTAVPAIQVLTHDFTCCAVDEKDVASATSSVESIPGKLTAVRNMILGKVRLRDNLHRDSIDKERRQLVLCTPPSNAQYCIEIVQTGMGISLLRFLIIFDLLLQ